MTSNHGDHSDLDSLFGDDESCQNDQQSTHPRPVISFPRAAVASQNVGTIAHFPVPSSSEHPHSSGPMSSASIPLTRNSVDTRSRSEARGKRNASPQPHQANKKRRVEPEGCMSGAQRRVVKQSVDAFGLPTSMERALTAETVQAALNLLAPRTNSSQSRPRTSKGSRKVAPGPTSAVSGAGSATDPVIIPDEPSPFPTSNSPSRATPSKGSAQSSTRRLTRSQEAHALLEALPTDPTDILSQTLRTILKTPTTIPHSRNSAPRDIAIYLANGRHTGTPFLRLLRHLVGSTRHTNPKLGLDMLKKLVEAMRMMEETASKTAMPSQSSAASTPMPTTPGTPSTASFPVAESSTTFHPSNHAFESGLFAPPELAFQSSESSFGPFGDLHKQPSTDVVIDPQLLAISQGSNYLQLAPDVPQNFDINLEELLGALPTPLTSVPSLDSSTNSTADAAEGLDVAGLPTWDELANIPLHTFFDTWFPVPAESTSAVQPAVAAPLPRSSYNPTAQVTQRVSKQSDLPPGGIRIPPRSEATALLERARARKSEIEAKIKSARRQAWACMIEAGVERTLLGKLQGDGVGDA